MTTDDETLALIDAAMANLQRLRERVADAAEPEPAPDVTDDDFAPYNLIDTATASERFGIPRDTITRWCRETKRHGDQAIGVKIGGRWHVSISRIRKLKL